MRPRLPCVAGLLAPLLAAAALAATPAPSPTAGAAASGAGRAVVRLVIDGTINPATADYIHDGLADAAARGAAALVIELDTPGGLLESTKSIVQDLLAAPLPVIVYVAPRGAGASSAGVFITLAAHVAAMAPGTNIGSAHPVGGQGETIDGDMGEKIENFTASFGRTIAEQRGRNVEWAEQAVRESVSATEGEAVKLKIVDFVAADLDDVLRQANGRRVVLPSGPVTVATAGATVEPFAMSWRQVVLNLLAHPNVAYFLLMAGLLGLYVEFTNPGLLFPGVAGAICLLVALAALQVLPINYSGLALIGLGIAMLIAETFLPSFGVVGVGGMVAFVLGSLLLFDTPDASMQLDRGLIAGAALTLGGFALGVGWLVLRSQRSRSPVGAEGMVGEVGEVRRVNARRAKVFVHGEYWDAASDEPLAVGDAVEVVAIDGLHLRVRRRGAG